MKTIVFSRQSAKLFDALSKEVQDAVEGALAAYATRGVGDVKKLRGSKDVYRLRVGRYRVFFTEDSIVVLVIYVGKRETTTYK